MTNEELKQVVQRSIDAGTSLDWSYTTDPRYVGIIADITRDAAATAQPRETTQAGPAVDGATDEQIKKFIIKIWNTGKTRTQIKTALLEEYEGCDEDADDLIFSALEKETEAAL